MQSAADGLASVDEVRARALDEVLKLMGVPAKDFRACEFVKEDSCLLGVIGKVFDQAGQQGLPGRDAQMAEVKEGAEAVAAFESSRCSVTVLSRGPGSGKSTALVFIADNWEKI